MKTAELEKLSRELVDFTSAYLQCHSRYNYARMESACKRLKTKLRYEQTAIDSEQRTSI